MVSSGEDYGEATLRALAPHMMNAYIQNHALVPQAGADRADGEYHYQTLGRNVPYNDLLLWEDGGVDSHRRVHNNGSILSDS